MSIINFKLHGEQGSISTQLTTTEDRKTSRETATAERGWFMFVSLRERPRCFGCGGRMLSKTVRVQANYGVCELCNDIDWSEYRPFWLAIESLSPGTELTRSRGIIFWTPPLNYPDDCAYQRWLDLWDKMRGPRSSDPIAGTARR